MVGRMQVVEEVIDEAADSDSTLQLLGFCHWMKGFSRGWSGSWNLLGWSMPGGCCRRRGALEHCEGLQELSRLGDSHLLVVFSVLS